jgi:hypothetical protein
MMGKDDAMLRAIEVPSTSGAEGAGGRRRKRTSLRKSCCLSIEVQLTHSGKELEAHTLCILNGSSIRPLLRPTIRWARFTLKSHRLSLSTSTMSLHSA